ncbi:MAG: PDZ domain-containing protein [Gemmataceae bacterium]
MNLRLLTKKSLGTILGSSVAVLLLSWSSVGEIRSQEKGQKPKADTSKKAAKNESKTTPISADYLKPFQWRSIGPAAMGGRITAISVYAKQPTTFYAATASGGLLKTTNNGMTFEHQFDDQRTVSIGDVCVAPSNPDIVWVGTGESNPRNSVSYGDGVYKSTDGGKTWKNMGLKESFQIGKIIVHPTNPEVVYVGALGRLYGPNAERGLFKTTNGGKTWNKILDLGNKTGIIDMRMHPENPETLLVAAWSRKRDGFDGNDPAVKWSETSGLYRTTDGGKSFQKITKGLPTGKIGRIGLDWSRSNPNIVYMVLDSEKIGSDPLKLASGGAYMGVTGGQGPGARLSRVVPNSPAAKAGLQNNDVVIQFGGTKVKTYTGLISQIRRRKAGDKVDIVVDRNNKQIKLKLVLGSRGNSTRPFTAYLGGQRENIQNKQGKKGFELGGVYKSTDSGVSWKRINSLNPRPMYFSQIRVDPSDPNAIWVLGIAVHYSKDGGKKFSTVRSSVHPDHHALWIDPNNPNHLILGNDGGIYVTYDRMRQWDHHNHMAIGQFYHVAVGPRTHYNVYGGLQDNGTWGGPAFTKSSSGPVNSDWFRVGGGDGFRCAVDANDPDLVYCESQGGRIRRRNYRTGESASLNPPRVSGIRSRFNWNTPFILSNHNSKIFYCGGTVVYKSLDRGNNLRAISPKITRTDRGSATALAESPIDPQVMYVGTDDGALHVTTDGGNTWSSVIENVGLPGPFWVASIEASRAKRGRAYVAFDAHRSNDDNPYIYVTEDFGKTWTSINNNLPWGSTRVLREDIKNPNLLYLGTEFGAWCSLDRGKQWVSLNTNLPTVAVHEFAIHPTMNEVVAATHGRSLWVLDVAALRQLSPTPSQKVTLFKPSRGIRWRYVPSRGRTNREFVGTNRSRSAAIYYSLPKDAKSVDLRVKDAQGNEVRRLKVSKQAGLHRTTWDLLRVTRRQGRPGQGRGGRVRGGAAKPGVYQLVLTVDNETFSQSIAVESDPTLPSDAIVGQLDLRANESEEPRDDQ